MRKSCNLICMSHASSAEVRESGFLGSCLSINCRQSPIGNQSAVRALWLLLWRCYQEKAYRQLCREGGGLATGIWVLLIRKKNSPPFEEMPFSHCLTQCIQNMRDGKRHVNMCRVYIYIFILYIEKETEWERDSRDRCGKVRENAPFPALPKFVIKRQAEVRKNFSNAPNAYKRYGQPYAIRMQSVTEREGEEGKRINAEQKRSKTEETLISTAAQTRRRRQR